MRICIFGTYDASHHPRIHTLSEGLRSHGHEVLACNAPLGVDTAGRVDAVSSPRGACTLLRRLLSSWVRLLWRSRRVRGVDAVLVGYLGVLDVLLARVRWPRTPLVLDHLAPVSGTGADRQLGGRIRGGLLAAVDATAERIADLVVVDTREHADALPPPHRRNAVVVPVGAPNRWFLRPERRPVPPLRVVFFGLYTPLQGAPVIAHALRDLLDGGVALEATMIGSGQELEAVREIAGTTPGIRWRSWVPSEELADLVAAHDVCLGIFGRTLKAMRVVPNKVFQGAAAGCAIITSDTPPQRESLGPAALYVPAGDPEALAGVLSELADDEELVWQARQEAHRWASQRFRPASVTEPLQARLVTLEGRAATR